MMLVGSKVKVNNILDLLSIEITLSLSLSLLYMGLYRIFNLRMLRLTKLKLGGCCWGVRSLLVFSV